MLLIDTFIDILYFTIVNDSYGFEQFSFPMLKKRYEDMVTASEKMAQARGIPEHIWRKSFFAIAVWVDETILLSDWTDKTQWCKETLQRTYFKTSNGGIEFFSSLERLDTTENQIREIYDLCLSLGFRGSYYRESDTSILKKIIHQTIQILRSDRNLEPPGVLFPCAYKGSGKLNIVVEKEYRLLFLALITVVPVLTFILLYIFFDTTLSGMVQECLQLFGSSIN